MEKRMAYLRRASQPTCDFTGKMRPKGTGHACPLEAASEMGEQRGTNSRFFVLYSNKICEKIGLSMDKFGSPYHHGFILNTNRFRSNK